MKYKHGGIIWSVGIGEDNATPFLVVDTTFDSVKLFNLEDSDVINILARHLDGMLEDMSQNLYYEDPP